MLPPAGQTFSRTQLIRIWDNAGKGVPEFVTLKPYDLDSNGDPVSIAAATAAAAAAGAAGGAAAGTARRIAAAAAAIGATATGAAEAAPGDPSTATVAAAAKELPNPAPKPELKMVPQGPEPVAPSQDPAQLVDRQVWRMWEGHGWFAGVVTSWDESKCVHEVVFAKGTPQQVDERMNLLSPPVTISWRDPRRLMSATAAAIAQAAQQQGAAAAHSAYTSASGGVFFPCTASGLLHAGNMRKLAALSASLSLLR
ncbi:MAG: hypothetical protein HC767_08185 [Akkermansiaceae bacterium]|nr:hypothetical protein [Akkermansiaceae bacterium]